jgi:hypothetical protein
MQNKREPEQWDKTRRFMSSFLLLVTDSPQQPSAIWPDCTYYFLLVIMSDNQDLAFVVTQRVRLFTACSNVRIENLMCLPYWSRISLHFKATEDSLSSSQKLAEEPYIDPNVSSPQPHAVFRRIHWNTMFPHTPYLLTPRSRVLLEKLTGFAANQDILHILWNPKVHYRTHKRPLPHTPRSAKRFPTFGLSQTKFCMNLSSSQACYMCSQSPVFNRPNYIWWRL